MGEACVRGNASNGDGVYKSVDARQDLAQRRAPGQLPHRRREGASQESRHRLRRRARPSLGAQRDARRLPHYRRRRDVEAGLHPRARCRRNRSAFDPSNPRVIYAGFWQVRRNPYHFDSGGPGSGLFKSIDGGDTWTDISRAPGLPKGVLGRIGITVSPANPERVWALVEAADGGVFRSDNAGRNWTRVNEQSMLRQRAWYYSHIIADPQNADTVYALNVGMYRSIDGGRTWSPIVPPHGDNHALWIAPDNPLRMVQGNDGGARSATTAGAPGPAS